MPKQFSIPAVVRMIPKFVLKEFFEVQGHKEFDPGWDSLGQREFQPIVQYLETLSKDERNEFESLLRSFFELSTSDGMAARIEAARYIGEPDFTEEFPEDLGLHGRVVLTWIRFRDIFDKARIIHEVDHLPWWRKRDDLPRHDPDFSSSSVERLESAIAELFKEHGRGDVCTVERMKRGDVHYFFAYPDDFVADFLVHETDGILIARTLRQTLQVVFAFNPEAHSLELYAKLPKEMRGKLEAIFTRAILHADLGPMEPPPVYRLNTLRDRSFECWTEPEDAVRVWIRKMRLSEKFDGRQITVEIDDTDGSDNIYRALDDCVNFKVLPLTEWNVTMVSFRFEFLPLEGRKPSRHVVDVASPHSCNLRGIPPDRVDIVQKYLKLWKLDGRPYPKNYRIAVGE